VYSIVLAAFLTTGNDTAAFGRRHGGCRGGGGYYSAGCFGCWGGGYAYGCYGYGGCFGCGGGGGCFGCGGGGGCFGCGGGAAGGRAAGGGGASMAGGSGGGSSEVTESIKELKKSLVELKEEQNKLRIEGLKRTAEELRYKQIDQKINELRRGIEELKVRPAPGTFPIPLPIPQPGPRPVPQLPAPQPGPRPVPQLPAPQPGKVLLDLPADALLIVNDRVAKTASVFTTPSLEPGKATVFTFEAVVVRGDKCSTRIKRLSLRAGEEVRLAYADMEPAESLWTEEAATAAPAHITVRLPADAQLTVQGIDCPLTSGTRAFDTPPLKPNREYSYTLTMKVRRSGRVVERTQRIVFRSGRQVTVSFDNESVNGVATR
jgi:uncharacterized protein (TIGR03000 family)